MKLTILMCLGLVVGCDHSVPAGLDLAGQDGSRPDLASGSRADLAAADGSADLGQGSDLAAPDLGAPDSGTGDAARGAIEHIIIIVKENHTFDNFFGSFPGAEGTTTAKTSTGVITVPHAPLTLTRDPNHSHAAGLINWHGGLMDQWDLGDPPNATDRLAYSQYLETDIPNYWKLARNFALADHYFSGMIGPSFPGHLFYFAAQGAWAIDNPSQLVPWGCDDATGTTIQVLDRGTCSLTNVFPCFDVPVVPDLLPSNLTWGVYASTLPPLIGEPWTMLDAVRHIRNSPAWSSHVFDVSRFATDLQAGTLPNVVWVINQDLASEHPPFNICDGENWTVAVVNLVMQSATYWPKSAILISWDDFGGWYDHVPPPMQYGCDAANPYGLGFRLPLIIVSPWVKPHQVYKNVAHQGSVPKFVEAIFRLPTLNSMDPAAQDGPGTDDLTAAFDFTQTPNPPLALTPRFCLGQR